MSNLNITVTAPVTVTVDLGAGVTSDVVIGQLQAFAAANPTADWSTLKLDITA